MVLDDSKVGGPGFLRPTLRGETAKNGAPRGLELVKDGPPAHQPQRTYTVKVGAIRVGHSEPGDYCSSLRLVILRETFNPGALGTFPVAVMVPS